MAVEIVRYSKEMDYERIAKDLGLEVDYVKNYFKNYVINHVMPIRSLDYQETMFVKAIKYVKELTMEQHKDHLDAYEITEDDLMEDPLLLEKNLSSFNNPHHYDLVRKYSLFILEPALLYNNLLAPLLDRLTLEQEIIMLTNFAAGRGYNGNPVGIKDRLAAIQMLSEKPVLTANTEDRTKALTLEEIRGYLELTKRDGIGSDSEEKFAKEIMKLKEKRDGGEDPVLVDAKEKKKLDKLSKPYIPHTKK